MKKESDKLENQLRDIQNTGQNIGEILKQLDSEKCNFYT
jgi:flagellar biosynthesis chaperone FliJ